MRDGYQVRTREGGTTPRHRARRTRPAGSTTSAELRGGPRRLPAALRLTGRRRPRAQPAGATCCRPRAAAGKPVEATSDLPLLVLPTAGAADAATLQAAAALEPARRAAGRQRHPREPVRCSPAAPGTARPHLHRGGLGGGPGPDPRDDAVHIQQRLLATSWIETSSTGGARGGPGAPRPEQRPRPPRPTQTTRPGRRAPR